MKFLFSLVVFTLCTRPIMSQIFYAHRYEDTDYVSIGAGTAGYYGDLQRQLIIPYPSLSFELSHKLGPQVKFRKALTLFLLGAHDANQKQDDLKERNLSFKSANAEISFTFEFLLIPIYSFRSRPLVIPFISAGLGAVTVNPRAELNGKFYNLRKLQTEGQKYSGIELVAPLGVGLEFAIAEYVSFITEFAYRFTRTDYLDDVSGVYTHISPVERVRYSLADRAPEIGLPAKRKGMIRGNPEVKDGYAILNFKLQFILSHVFRNG